jgi:two-component system, sensor histidine kinase LadS
MLRAKQILPSNAFTQNSVQFGAALQMVLLSLSLNNKINLMRVDKEKALAQKLSETEKNIALTSTFKKFVPEQFLDLLGKKNITDIKLGDEIESEMTILFSDIRSFSLITQKLGARDSFNFINAYLEKMEPAIETNSGFIDKYIGDSIMALFPKTSDHALAAAINMQKQITKLNDKGGILGINPIEIGVGINTGQMMLGTIGGPNRMESTVISDAVNVAAQIEKRTKQFKSAILITESSYRKLKKKEDFSIRLIDRIVLNESQKRSMLYEVFDSDQIDFRELKEKNIDQFEEAVKSYLSEEYLKCYEILKEYLESVPADYAAKKYMELCHEHFEKMD